MAAKNTISKLEIIKEISVNKEVQQLAQVMIDYIRENEKSQLGFRADKNASD